MNTTKANIHPQQNILKDKMNTKKLIASYDLWLGNRTCLFWRSSYVRK